MIFNLKVLVFSYELCDSDNATRVGPLKVLWIIHVYDLENFTKPYTYKVFKSWLWKKNAYSHFDSWCLKAVHFFGYVKVINVYITFMTSISIHLSGRRSRTLNMAVSPLRWFRFVWEGQCHESRGHNIRDFIRRLKKEWLDLVRDSEIFPTKYTCVMVKCKHP